MKLTRIVISVLALLSLVAGMYLARAAGVDEQALLDGLVPGVRFSEKIGALPHYPSGQAMVAYNSYEIAPAVKGYAGPIKALVALDSSGRITGLRLIEHYETKNYVWFMETPDYLGRFVGKSIMDPFEVDRDVDGISRATVSVEALARTVRESSREVASRLYRIDVPGTADGRRGRLDWLWYSLLFVAASAGYVLTRRDRRFLRLRDVSMASSLVVTGIILATPFSVLHVFNLLLFGPSVSPLWLVLVASTIGSVLLAGRFYCGWLCPFGALSEFIGRIPLRKWDVSSLTDNRWRYLKYVIFSIVAAAVLVARRPDYGNYETYVALFSLSGSVPAWLLVGVSLAANLRVPRFWCRYLCPVAALTGLFCHASRGYPTAQDCPMGNRPSAGISECIRCNRCYVREGAERDEL